MAPVDLRALAKRLRRNALLRRVLAQWPEGGARGNGAGGNRAVVNGISGSVAPGLAAHLGQGVHKRLGQLARCMDFAKTDDKVEALHDLRVASRRLRAFVTLFEPLLDERIVRHVGKPLRRVTRAAGALRDIDVQIALLEKRLPAETTDGTRAALEHLLERLARERDGVEARARRLLRKVDRDDVSVGVSAALGETVARLPASAGEMAEFVWSLLEPLVERVEADEPPPGSDPAAEKLHQLRISIKKLRYALELVVPLLGDGQRDLLRRAAELQEILGAHHDLTVIYALIDDERRGLESRGRKTLPFALTVLRGELEAEERALYASFEGVRAPPSYFRETIQAALAKFAGPPHTS